MKQVTFRIKTGFIKMLIFFVFKQDKSPINLIPWSYSEPSQKLQKRRVGINESFRQLSF